MQKVHSYSASNEETFNEWLPNADLPLSACSMLNDNNLLLRVRRHRERRKEGRGEKEKNKHNQLQSQKKKKKEIKYRQK